jgi:hypothetical protein
MIYHVIEEDVSNNFKEFYKFLAIPLDGRPKALLVDNVEILKSLQHIDHDFKQVKAIIFDSADELNKIKNIKIIDSQLKEHATWQMYRIMPEQLNRILHNTEDGVKIEAVLDQKEDQIEEDVQIAEDVVDEIAPEEEIPVTVKERLYFEPSADAFSGMLSHILETIQNNDVRDEFKVASIRYVSGQIRRQTFNLTKRKALKVGALKDDVDTLVKWVAGSEGKRLAEAYHAIAKFNMNTSKAAQVTGAILNEINFIVGISPPGPGTSFVKDLSNQVSAVVNYPVLFSS